MENVQDENPSFGEVAMSNSPVRNPILNPTPEHKLTAEQIETDCPERLRQIGEQIKVRLGKMDKEAAAYKRVLNHGIAVEKLLAEARSLCDDAGFQKFRELVCPQLSQSQAYKLLAIASGKKTFAEHQAEERERKRRTRAKQRAGAANSGTVPEQSEPPTDEDTAATDAATADGQPELPKPGSRTSHAPSVKDNALTDFNSLIARLLQKTHKANPRRFIDTAISPVDLSNLAKFILDVADLKSQSSAEISTEDRKAQHAALEAADDQEAA
jgi:hypothetical protein